MAENNSTTKDCPYWNPHCEQICTMTANGLYMPLSEHIAGFCRSPRWDQCPQYVAGCEAQLGMAWERELNQKHGHRRHWRISCSHLLALASSDTLMDQPVNSFTQCARTMNLSVGGMRIETVGALPEMKKFSFAFGDDFLAPGLRGLAEVRWQLEIDDSGTCQYGLGFIDQKSSCAISESLGLN